MTSASVSIAQTKAFGIPRSDLVFRGKVALADGQPFEFSVREGMMVTIERPAEGRKIGLSFFYDRTPSTLSSPERATVMIVDITDDGLGGEASNELAFRQESSCPSPANGSALRSCWMSRPAAISALQPRPRDSFAAPSWRPGLVFGTPTTIHAGQVRLEIKLSGLHYFDFGDSQRLAEIWSLARSNASALDPDQLAYFYGPDSDLSCCRMCGGALVCAGSVTSPCGDSCFSGGGGLEY